MKSSSNRAGQAILLRHVVVGGTMIGTLRQLKIK
jgi:hypothetical protein